MQQETLLRLARYFHVILPGLLVADAVHNAFVVHNLWQDRRKEWLLEDKESVRASALRTLQDVSSRCKASAFWPHGVAAVLEGSEAAVPRAIHEQGIAGTSPAGGVACVPGEDAAASHLLCGSAFLGSVLDSAAGPPRAAPGAAESRPEPGPAAPEALAAPQLRPLAAVREGLVAGVASRVPAAWMSSSVSQVASPTAMPALMRGPLQAALAALRRCQQAWQRGWDATGAKLEGAATRAVAAAQGALPLPRMAVTRRSALRSSVRWMGPRSPPRDALLERLLPSD